MEMLSEHQCPELKVRVSNVVDVMRLQPPSEHPHGLSDQEFSDVIDRVSTLGARAAYVQQESRDTLLEHQRYIETHGEDPAESRNWRWGTSEAPKRTPRRRQPQAK